MDAIYTNKIKDFSGIATGGVCAAIVVAQHVMSAGAFDLTPG